MLRDKDLARLIERFLDGTTTQAEERQLYAYFASPHVSERWEPYRQMFQDYAALDAGEAQASAARPVRRFRLWHAVAGVAAVALLCVGVGALLRLHEERTLQRLYGGSYVIDNGQRIDDLRAIATRLDSTLAYAATVERQVETDADLMRQAESDVLDNIDNPQMRQTVMQILNE